MSSERKRRLLQALRGGRTESDCIELGGVQVKLRILSSGEKDDCRLEAAAAATDVSETEREGWVAADTVYRVLARALIDPDDSEPIGDYAEIRRSISSPYLTLLSREYQRLEALSAPQSAAELDALYAEVHQHVGESGEPLAAFLRTLDYSTLLSFAISMASRLAS